MQFVNLDKIKIHKSYSFKTNELEVDLNNTITIFDIKERVRQCFNYFIEESGVENYYKINIIKDPANEKDDLDGYFLTVVNIISAIFFDVMCTTKGRRRERRLDVPEHLKVIKTNMSLLKRAINAQTLVDSFNLCICWDIDDNEQLVYELVPQNKEDE